MKTHMHQLPELLDAAADLLDHVGDVAGLRAGLYTALPDVRLLVKTGHPYTNEVGPLDMIGAALTAEVHHKRWGTLGEAHVSGTWNDMPVYGSHLYSDLPDGEKPCTRSATDLSLRARALIPWARQSWTQWAESVHVYDENGTPRVHVVLKPDGSLDDTLAVLLDSTGPLQYRHEREHAFVANGSVLLNDGTVVTASVITP